MGRHPEPPTREQAGAVRDVEEVGGKLVCPATAIIHVMQHELAKGRLKSTSLFTLSAENVPIQTDYPFCGALS